MNAMSMATACHCGYGRIPGDAGRRVIAIVNGRSRADAMDDGAEARRITCAAS